MNKIRLGDPLIHLKTTDSTNNYAWELLQNTSTEPGTVILADFQTNGKGQGENHWNSDEKANLLFSIILKPTFLEATRQFYLSMAISNGIAFFIQQYSDQIKIKWPNDLYASNKKICGILIENTVMGNFLYTSVVGIGLNVNQQRFPTELSGATSLYLLTGKKFDLNDMLRQLLNNISDQLETLVQHNHSKIRIDYLNQLYLHHEWHTYEDATGTYTGRIIDIEESGEILIRSQSGEIKKYGFREVRF
jgi:BirA family transcriptional regulator, biotin operon repressor / biotin---[acetyl-CoA-carboxylase] ligase